MVVVIYLEFLQEMHGFVTCGDVSENVGVIICCRSGIPTDCHTAVSFLTRKERKKVRVLSVV